MKITFITKTWQQTSGNYDAAPMPRTKTFDSDQRISEVIDWIKLIRSKALGGEAVLVSEDWEQQ